VLPIVLGALIGLTAKDLGLAGPDNRNAQTTLLFLVIVAAFTGGFSSVRELIKERPPSQGWGQSRTLAQ